MIPDYIKSPDLFQFREMLKEAQIISIRSGNEVTIHVDENVLKLFVDELIRVAVEEYGSHDRR